MGHGRRICGVDEAGRGPIAGPVCAAAVLLDPARAIEGLADSKLLTERRREALAVEIRAKALAWSVAWASVEEIDRHNILRATLLAMQRAIRGLAVLPDEAWVDGNRCPEADCTVRAFVGGDRLHAPISAASILAKCARDAEMRRLHGIYPQYRLDRHKGYPTPEHLELLAQHGACEIHRRSFAPVSARLR
jgi:ribonuclease HII